MNKLSGQGILKDKVLLKHRTFVGLGWISAVMALVIYPLVFGMLGVVSGILSCKDTESKVGVYIIVVSIILMCLGLFFSTQLMGMAKELFLRI